MMKIHIRHIRKEGYDLPMSAQDDWLMKIMNNLFPNQTLESHSITGQIHLDNLSGNIHLSGSIKFTHHPCCARCGTELTHHENIPLQATFLPCEALTGEERTTVEEEIELTTEDLDFAFYENEEVTIDPVVNDEIALALPYNYYCPQETPCVSSFKNSDDLSPSESLDPRWEGFRGVKFRN